MVQITLNNKKKSPDNKHKSTGNFRRSIEINFIAKPVRKALREKTNVSQLLCHDCQQQQDLPQEVSPEQSILEVNIPGVTSEVPCEKVPLHQQPLNELLKFFNLNCKQKSLFIGAIIYNKPRSLFSSLTNRKKERFSLLFLRGFKTPLTVLNIVFYLSQFLTNFLYFW